MNPVMALPFLLLVASAGASVSAGRGSTNPLGTVIALMDSLAAKVTKEGEAEAKAYQEYFEWCDDASKNFGFDIKDATNKKDKLEAMIAKSADDSEASAGKIEELAASIATAEGEARDATLIREKEAADFAAEEKELAEILSALTRAIQIIEREMAKNPAAFAQVDASRLDGLVKSMSALVDAAALSSADKGKLMAFAQAQQTTEDDDDAPGAPAAATYKTHSTSIFDVLEDLKEKAEEQLASLRKAETNTKHNFNLLKQSLEDQISVDTKHMTEEKAAKASSDGTKATAEGDLAMTVKTLDDLKAGLASAHSNCLQTAADHEATVAARTVELKVIAEAKRILLSSTGGAVAQTYSLFQEAQLAEAGSQLRTRADLARAEVVTLVKRLAREHHSAALAQLASRISAVLRFGGGAGGQDPFTKVKGLIQDMIMKLEATAQSEATEKAWCDEQMAKTEEKKSELDEDIAKLTSKIDVASARSASLKAEVKTLQGELAALAKSQAEMDSIRAETHSDYVQAKSDLESGLEGVRKALSMLREYYGSAAAAASALVQSSAAFDAYMQQPAAPVIHSKATGAGDSIIGILEVVESDFAKNLAAEETQEADAADEYEKTTQSNAVTKTVKIQDVKYKTQEFMGLDKTVSELSSDRASANSELSAVMEYYGQVKERCIAKPETYEARQTQRQAEIKGLKEALQILEDETAFVQRRKRGHSGHFLGVARQ
jgi:cell division protein FtsB